MGRARFKWALRQCRKNEQGLRAEAVAYKYRSRNVKSFWHELKRIDASKPKLAQSVDGVVGEIQICQLWKTKFSAILNSVPDNGEENALCNMLSNLSAADIPGITAEEIYVAAGLVDSGKAPGLDLVPGEFL